MQHSHISSSSSSSSTSTIPTKLDQSENQEKMASSCRINISPNKKIQLNSTVIRRTTRVIACTSTISTAVPSSNASYNVSFKTLSACKLGISRYPDFDYNASGGTGTGTAIATKSSENNISVEFDLETLYIPPLTSETTRFLGLPLPPGLKIDIVPVSFNGRIAQESGKVEFEFVANFCFTVGGGSLYRAPPLLVKTVLTTEESKGTIRSGKGERLDKEGKCRLVGVAAVDRIDDGFMNTFLSLPTECLAVLNAVVSVS